MPQAALPQLGDSAPLYPRLPAPNALNQNNFAKINPTEFKACDTGFISDMGRLRYQSRQRWRCGLNVMRSKSARKEIAAPRDERKRRTLQVFWRLHCTSAGNGRKALRAIGMNSVVSGRKAGEVRTDPSVEHGAPAQRLICPQTLGMPGLRRNASVLPPAAQQTAQGRASANPGTTILRSFSRSAPLLSRCARRSCARSKLRDSRLH